MLHWLASRDLLPFVSIFRSHAVDPLVPIVLVLDVVNESLMPIPYVDAQYEQLSLGGQIPNTKLHTTEQISKVTKSDDGK